MLRSSGSIEDLCALFNYLTNNYRPISLLLAISKMFEKLLFEQILNFLHDNNLLSPQQFGFRTGSSTAKAENNRLF
jgi:hypothetical protein